MIVNLVDLNVVLAGKLLNAFTSCCETIFFSWMFVSQQYKGNLGWLWSLILPTRKRDWQHNVPLVTGRSFKQFFNISRFSLDSCWVLSEYPNISRGFRVFKDFVWLRPLCFEYLKCYSTRCSNAENNRILHIRVVLIDIWYFFHEWAEWPYCPSACGIRSQPEVPISIPWGSSEREHSDTHQRSYEIPNFAPRSDNWSTKFSLDHNNVVATGLCCVRIVSHKWTISYLFVVYRFCFVHFPLI